MLQLLLVLLACSAPARETGGSDSGVTGTDGGSADGGGADGGGTAPEGAHLDEEIGTLVTVSWHLEEAASTWLEFHLPSEDWRSTPARELDAGPVEELLLGLPFASTFDYRVAIESGTGVDYGPEQTFATGPVPETLPLATVLESLPERWEPTLQYLFMSVRATEEGGYDDWAMIIDRQGRPVWALQNPPEAATIHPRISFDGTEMLIDHNSQWVLFDEGAASEVVRMRIDGTVVDVIDTPGLRHPYTDMDDGSIVYAQAGTNLEEVLVQVQPDGTRTVFWSCTAWRAANDLAGSCGSNSLSWDPATDHFLYSLYTMETLVEVDHVSGETVRWFGRSLGAWAFAPVESAFWWQHGAYYTDAGTLLMSARISQDGRETVVREYTRDEERQTLVETTTLGLGEGLYGEVMGEAHRLPGGHTLHNLGTGSRIREYEPDGGVVWDLSWDAAFIGRSTPVEDLYRLLR